MPHAKTQFHNLCRDELMNSKVFSWFPREDNVSAGETDTNEEKPLGT